MDAEPKQIDFYVTHDGKAPFEQWLVRLQIAGGSEGD